MARKQRTLVLKRSLIEKARDEVGEDIYFLEDYEAFLRELAQAHGLELRLEGHYSKNTASFRNA